MPKKKNKDEKTSLKHLTDEQVEMFKKVSRSSNLRQISLIESAFKCELPVYFEGKKENNLEFSVGGELRFRHFDPNEADGVVVYEWEVLAKAGEDEAVKLNSTYVVSYDVPADCDEKMVLMFLEQVGRIACYPYFRNQVSQKSWEANVELPILPVLST